MPVVRLAETVDVEAICRTDPIARSESRRREEIVRGVDAGEAWVVEWERRIVGYALMSCGFFDRPFIGLVVIDPGHRGQGLGPLLIRHLETVCPRNELFTSTNESNAHMQHVLEKLGYQRSGVIHNLDPGDPEIVYFKALRRAE
jgi:GNAT superfamily N-acetyltransferase